MVAISWPLVKMVKGISLGTATVSRCHSSPEKKLQVTFGVTLLAETSSIVFLALLCISYDSQAK
jgi:hypothetical protein